MTISPARRRTIATLATASTAMRTVHAANEGLRTASGPFDVRIEIDGERRLGPTNPLLIGSNVPWIHAGEGLLSAEGLPRPEMLARVREWSPPILRYMAGEPAIGFHWRQGLGPMGTRPLVQPDRWQAPQRILLGTQEFLELCESQGAQPLIQVNLFEGNEKALASQVSDWVRTINVDRLRSRLTGKPLPKVPYWELGNEPYVRDSRTADGRANREFFTPAVFARRVDAAMSAMLAVDPSLRIVVPFALDTLSGRPWHPGGEQATVVGEQLGYARGLLDALSVPERLYGLALHLYMPLVGLASPLSLAAVPDDDGLYWAAVAGSETLRLHLDAVARFWSAQAQTASRPMPRLMVTEYNAFFTNAHLASAGGHERPLDQNRYISTQAGALFVADLIRVMAQAPAVQAAMLWSLSGNGEFGAIDSEPGHSPARVRPAFHVMRMARSALANGGYHVAHRTTSPRRRAPDSRIGLAEPYPDMPLLATMATRQGRRLNLMLLNKDPARPARITVDLTDCRASDARIEQLGANGVFAPWTSRNGPRMTTPHVDLRYDGRRADLRIDPAGIALLTFTLK